MIWDKTSCKTFPGFSRLISICFKKNHAGYNEGYNEKTTTQPLLMPQRRTFSGNIFGRGQRPFTRRRQLRLLSSCPVLRIFGRKDTVAVGKSDAKSDAMRTEKRTAIRTVYGRDAVFVLVLSSKPDGFSNDVRTRRPPPLIDLRPF